MSRRIGISHYTMNALGWSRMDPKPWTKCAARWWHARLGWRIHHCGHATALHPYVLYNPAGELVLTGVAGPHRRPDFGTAWNDLESAACWPLEAERMAKHA